jgi:exodeoxyribonuclease III
MKLISWNLNGIRAVAKKGLNQLIYQMNPDIIGFQETKAQDDQVKEALADLKGYNLYSNSAEKKGYSGTAILSKSKPLNVIYGIGIEEFDNEGRVLTLEFENFYFTTVYVPNSGGQLLRLDYRVSWDKEFLSFLKELELKKPVFVCGDFNVAHKEIDLKNPKSNYNKSAGYMQEEIDGLNNFINAGFKDTFRHYNPETIKYSWWSYRFNSRARNIGWRIDYFLASEKLVDTIENTFILNEILGSDHCPVGIEM